MYIKQIEELRKVYDPAKKNTQEELEQAFASFEELRKAYNEADAISRDYVDIDDYPELAGKYTQDELEQAYSAFEYEMSDLQIAIATHPGFKFDEDSYGTIAHWIENSFEEDEWVYYMNLLGTHPVSTITDIVESDLTGKRLSLEEIKVYVDEILSIDHKLVVRKALLDLRYCNTDVTLQDIQRFMNPEFSPDQMAKVLSGLTQDDMTIEQVSVIANPIYPPRIMESMKEMYLQEIDPDEILAAANDQLEEHNQFQSLSLDEKAQYMFDTMDEEYERLLTEHGSPDKVPKRWYESIIGPPPTSGITPDAHPLLYAIKQDIPTSNKTSPSLEM